MQACPSGDVVGDFVCRGPRAGAPNRHSLSSKLSWNRRGMRNNLSSPTLVLLAVFPRGAVQGKLTPGSDLAAWTPYAAAGFCPGESQGSGWFAQPQTPLLSREVRSVLPLPPPIGTFSFCIFSEHSHDSGDQPASQHLSQHSSHLAWGRYEDTAIFRT